MIFNFVDTFVGRIWILPLIERSETHTQTCAYHTNSPTGWPYVPNWDDLCKEEEDEVLDLLWQLAAVKNVYTDVCVCVLLLSARIGVFMVLRTFARGQLISKLLLAFQFDFSVFRVVNIGQSPWIRYRWECRQSKRLKIQRKIQKFVYRPSLCQRPSGSQMHRRPKNTRLKVSESWLEVIEETIHDVHFRNYRPGSIECIQVWVRESWWHRTAVAGAEEGELRHHHTHFHRTSNENFVIYRLRIKWPVKMASKWSYSCKRSPIFTSTPIWSILCEIPWPSNNTSEWYTFEIYLNDVNMNVGSSTQRRIERTISSPACCVRRKRAMHTCWPSHATPIPISTRSTTLLTPSLDALRTSRKLSPPWRIASKTCCSPSIKLSRST